jgi:hypothetical protein
MTEYPIILLQLHNLWMIIEWVFQKTSQIYSTVQYRNGTIIIVIDVIIYTDKWSYNYHIKIILKY